MRKPRFTSYILTPPSINGERCRWLLKYFGVENDLRQFTLTPWALVPALRYASKATGSRFVYIVDKQQGLVFRDPYLLLNYLNTQYDQQVKLSTFDDPKFEEIMSLLEEHVRNWAYANFPRHWKVFLSTMTHGVPFCQRIIFYALYPFLLLIFRFTYTLDKAKTSFSHLEKSMDIADSLLSDGRKFIDGVSFSYADIALCTNFSPLLLPEEYGETGALAKLNDLPDPLRSCIFSLRQRPIGHYVLNIYKNFRTKQ